jgi:ferredoxin/flavodoxin---NADP+ reductase
MTTIQTKIDDYLTIALGAFRVRSVRFLTQNTFVIRTDKNQLDFIPGQRIKMYLRDESVNRKYSIYSGKDEPFLEFLIREVENGYMTPRLKPMKSGDELEIFGPNGHFTLQKIHKESDKLLFVSTGTGIAPFHSFIKSYPDLDYQLVHGVSFSDEVYDQDDYDKQRLIVCSSREVGNDFNGRVTDYLRTIDLKPFDHIFLCGNKEMINEVILLAKEKGFEKEQLHTEVYF